MEMNSLSDKQRLLVYLSAISVTALIIVRFMWGMTEMLSIAMFMIIILLITQSIWLSEAYVKNKVRLASLLLISSAYFFYPFWQPLVLALLIKQFPELSHFIGEDYSSPGGAFGFFFVLIGIFIVNYFMRDTSAMKQHETPLEKEFPEQNYKARLQKFCEVLRDDLRSLDVETQWSPMNFTPLDAEVEVRSESRRVKKVTDLLTAIKKTPKTDRTFLVLGDSGSGKSVALRKLCRDLLEEVDKTGKVPLYINLREWEIKKEWSEQNPPTVQQLYDFMLKNLQERLDIFGNDFLDTYFKRMFEHGRLFIVLDSFDEIPAVLDTPEGSWLIDKLSDVIYKFLAGAHESRGILSSRIFRKPTDKFQTKTRLEIRPFSEIKIRQTLEKSFSTEKKELIQKLFKERQDLMPVARNPFSAALISNYARNNDNALPQNQAELYISYIEHQLNVRSCQERIVKRGLTVEKIIETAEAIADLMFQDSQLGLGAPLEELACRLPEFAIKEVVEVLCYARLGRLGAGDDNMFSFAHRRFNEYFVSRQLIKHPERVPRESIPTNSRWRDALVLYCEVVEEEKAREIADYCWSEIKLILSEQLNMADPRYLRAVHSLRFLKEAFRARTTCLSNFREELADFIEHQIENAKDLLSKKLAVEAVGLLEESRIDSAVTKALAIKSDWIRETAFKACRHLSELSEILEIRLHQYLESSVDYCHLWKHKDEMLFPLSLSNAFVSLYRMILFKWWQLIFIFVLMLGLFITEPFIVMLATILTIFMYFFPFVGVKNTFTICKLELFKYIVIVTNLVMIVLFVTRLSKSYHSQFDEAFTNYSGLLHISDLAFSINIVLSTILLLSLFNNSLVLILKLIKGYLPKQFVSIVFFTTLRVINIAIFLLIKSFILFVMAAVLVITFGNSLTSLLEKILINSSIFYFILQYPLISYILSFVTIAISLNNFVVRIYILLILHIINFKDILNFKKMLKKISHSPRINRATIAKHFYKFKLPKNRLKFVRAIQTQGIIATGSWSDNTLPNVNDDEASTLLAQLEEKWLGLDR